jgi:hypothetical protein
MGRAAAMILVLCGLISSGWGFVQHHKAPQKRAPIDTTAGVAAAAELKDAGDQLYLTKRWADTYDGPDLKNFQDLTLVHADDTTFCLQVVKEEYVFRLLGPGGVPEPGTCQ